MSRNFADLYTETMRAKKSPVMVGLDPTVDMLPPALAETTKMHHGNTPDGVAEAFRRFLVPIVGAVRDVAVMVKPQAAFYEAYGPAGMQTLLSVVKKAQSVGLLCTLDAKRNDIGSTAKAYAHAYLGQPALFGNEIWKESFRFHIMTVTFWLGSDGVEPFLEEVTEHGRGVFLVLRTSNPSAVQLQDVLVPLANMEDWQATMIRERLAGLELDRLLEMVPAAKRDAARQKLGWISDLTSAPYYIFAATWVAKWGEPFTGQYGHSPVGAVVGAPYPAEAVVLRRLLPHTLFLVPGYGAQGGTADDVVPMFGADGLGAVVNNSRGLLNAWKTKPWSEQFTPDHFAQATCAAAEKMRDDITAALRKAGKCAW